MAKLGILHHLMLPECWAPGSAASAHALPDDASDSASVASTDTLSHWTSSDEEEPLIVELESEEAQSSSDTGMRLSAHAGTSEGRM